ncbi:hypothetical protein CAPN001_05200 [Capnocytophaga stomatis]|uniref:DUF58 domain-containing protein n=1 Tax=Capnocytophaga stomatis TaxID=1848904 RepID=UPI001951E8FF|nr:DUF58 domain-containing protein [Capnocytophaga stomatis]GIJ95951.1 hypothetical protein CAPN001_05200 [Capnocytophaga stomatis]
MDTKEILKKVRKIEIKTRRLSDNIFGGEYHSTFKGRGMTFSEVRPYQYGDDIRNIDWNVTARYNEPFVKVFEEERELTLMLMVDVSGSELFGTSQQFKSEMITEIAATLAFSALQNNDKTGLILFSDQIELYIPPKKGKSHVLRIIRELIEFEPKSYKTNIAQAFEFLSSVMKKKAIVFVLSDFMDRNYEKPVRIASRKHDVTGIRVYDAKETTLPNLGYITVKDAETGELLLVNTGSKATRIEYEKHYRETVSYFESLLQKSGAGTVSCRCDESYTQKLLGYFKRRG